MTNTSITLLLILLTTFGMSQQYCALRAYCVVTEDNPTCMPNITNYTDPVEAAPTQWDFTPDLQGMCPDYEHKANCCNNYTMTILKNNFVMLDPTFGNPSIGCSICAANLKRFWCKYNCDPNQHLFIQPGSSKVIDYNKSSTETIKVVTSNVSLEIKSTCALFESCKSVDFAKALGSMSTYQGLFNTFSSQAIGQGNVMMNFSYDNNATSLAVDVNNCSMHFDSDKDQYNYSLYGNQSWCNCQHCSSNCTAMKDFSLYIKQHGVLDGMNMVAIQRAAIVSLIILVLGLLLKYTIFSSSNHHKSGEEAMEEVKAGYFSSKESLIK